MPLSRMKIFGPALLDAVMETLPVGVLVTTAENLEVVAASDKASELIGLPRADMEGKPLAQIMLGLKLISPSGDVADLPELPVVRACRSGELIKNEEWAVERKDGQRTVVLVNATPIYAAGGQILGGLVCWTDVTSLKSVEDGLRNCMATEAVLLRESNHRIKNHLQMLVSLVRVEAQRAGITVRELAAGLEERLSVLAAAHQGFYAAPSRQAVKAGSLLESVVGALNSRQHPITTTCPPDLVLGEFQVTPIALAINEGVTNALKHAFSDGRFGQITVMIERDERETGTLTLEIADNGKGLPERSIEPGLGTQILAALARQLDGTFTLENRDTGGAIVRLRFPQAPMG